MKSTSRVWFNCPTSPKELDGQVRSEKTTSKAVNNLFLAPNANMNHSVLCHLQTYKDTTLLRSMNVFVREVALFIVKGLGRSELPKGYWFCCCGQLQALILSHRSGAEGDRSGQTKPFPGVQPPPANWPFRDQTCILAVWAGRRSLLNLPP